MPFIVGLWKFSQIRITFAILCRSWPWKWPLFFSLLSLLGRKLQNWDHVQGHVDWNCLSHQHLAIMKGSSLNLHITMGHDRYMSWSKPQTYGPRAKFFGHKASLKPSCNQPKPSTTRPSHPTPIEQLLYNCPQTIGSCDQQLRYDETPTGQEMKPEEKERQKRRDRETSRATPNQVITNHHHLPSKKKSTDQKGRIHGLVLLRSILVGLQPFRTCQIHDLHLAQPAWTQRGMVFHHQSSRFFASRVTMICFNLGLESTWKFQQCSVKVRNRSERGIHAIAGNI